MPGEYIPGDRRSHTDTVCRIAQAEQAYYKKKHLFTRSRVSLDTRKSLIKSVVCFWSRDLDCTGRAGRAKIEEFEVWCRKRTLKIPWTKTVKNVEVFKRMNSQKPIWNTLKLRKIAWIGNLIWNSFWITALLEGKIKGKHGKGRRRTLFLKQVMEDTGIRIYWKLKRNIGDMEK